MAGYLSQACKCEKMRLQSLSLLLNLQSSNPEDANLHELWADAISASGDFTQAFTHYKVGSVLHFHASNFNDSSRCAKKAISLANNKDLKIPSQDLDILQQVASKI